jgi:RHS repeat-associated protein
VVILGVVRVYRGRERIVEKIVLIGIVVFVMMAPFRYSQASRGVVFYYHNDHLNTPVKMTDEKGKIVWEVVSKHPFGSFEVSSKEVVLSDYTGNSNDSFNYKIENPIRFPGQYDDSDTKDVRSIILNNAEGLYYNYHRWYNPDIGRYMEVEPYKIIYFSRVKACYRDAYNQKIGHRYLYSVNNPIIFYDINGLLCSSIFKCLNCFESNLEDEDLKNKLRNSIYICDSTGDICIRQKGKPCCGYVYEGDTEHKIYITDECLYTCHTILHEIAHSYYNIDDDNEADQWANNRLSLCCDFN